MCGSDLPGVRRLRSVVGWSAEPAAFELLRGVAEARWAVAEEAGEIVGMVGAVPVGEVGILCHLAVHEAHRGRGIGAALSRWAVAYLRSLGTHTVRLYATAEARELYRTLGFRTVRRRLLLRGSGRARSREPGTGAAEVMRFGDLPEVVGHDRWWAGFDRSRVLKAALRLHPGAGLVVRESGRFRGYLLLSRFGERVRVGPFMAADPASARALLGRALELAGERTEVEAVFTGDERHPARSLYREFGFSGTEDRTMMEHGRPLSGSEESYATTAYLAT